MPIFSPPANVVTGGIIQASDVANLYYDISGQLDNQNIKLGGLLGTNLANNSVTITQIKNALVSFGVSPSAGNHSNGAYIILPSGAYSFFPAISTDGNVASRASLGGWRTADGVSEFDLAKPTGLSYNLGAGAVNAIVWVAILNPSVTGNTSIATITTYYIQSSPPYDLGDGEIPLFVFLMLDDATGDVLASYVAHDPPWAVPSEGRRLKMPVTVEEAISDPAKLTQLLGDLNQRHAHLANLEAAQGRVGSVTDPAQNAATHQQIKDMTAMVWDTAPVTQQEKNARMKDVPHPWILNDLTGKTVVMLDPFHEDVKALVLLHRAGENVVKLLHRTHSGIKAIDAVPGRKGPPGVTVIQPRLRKEK